MRPMVPLSIDADPWRALLSRPDIRMHDRGKIGRAHV